METNQYIVGLDIGTTKIAALIGQKNENGKIEILGLGQAESVGVTRGIVSHITPTVHAIQLAVEEAVAKSGIEIKNVMVGIAGQHIKSHQNRGFKVRENVEEEISKAELDEMRKEMFRLMTPPGEEIIDVLPQDYIIDNESGIKNPIGMAGCRLEGSFHIITGYVSAAKNIIKCVEKAGLNVSGLILEPLASSEAVLTDEEKEAGVVLVDIGGGTTDVAIFQDGIIRHTAVIPFGGNVVTDDIKEGCMIIRKQAEELKIKFGSALAGENLGNDIVVIPGLRDKPPKEISLYDLANIIQARMEEIIEQVYLEIKNSGFEKKLIAGIVVTGGGAQMKYIKQLFEFVTGMDTRIGYPTEHLSKGEDKITSPIYSTGVGLVITGFQRVESYFKNKQSLPDKNINTDEKNETNEKEEKKLGFFEKFLGKTMKNFFEDDGEITN
jgi:cell division protein FtsA